MDNPIPVTVFTGFLGAGKTTVILSLLSQLPKDYKVVLLKNEFGSQAVDQQLASQSSLAAVSEMINGCMCCVLVGQMKTALLEIKENYKPDRVIIETSGSAFPATLALQIRQLESEGFKLDAITTVIDAENFIGYEDKSITARMQAQYTDIILLNKWENVTERELDLVIDRLNDLNDETPRLRCSGKNGVPCTLIFGLDSTLYLKGKITTSQTDHHDEVETVTVRRGAILHAKAFQAVRHGDSHSHAEMSSDPQEEIPYIPLLRNTLDEALVALPKESVWRVKGFVRFANDHQAWILNWAFGRYELTPLDDANDQSEGQGQLQLTVMGARGETKYPAVAFARAVAGDLS